MKRFFLVVLLLPVFAMAQDCKIKKEVDQFSQQPKFTTGFLPLNEGMNRVLLSIDANNKEIDFFFAFNKGVAGKCFDDASTATVLYEGTRVKGNFRNTGSMNCDGLFHFTFKNTPTTQSALQRLATTKVASIQLTGTDKKVIEIVLKEEEKLMLMQMISCISKEAKTLLAKP